MTYRLSCARREFEDQLDLAVKELAPLYKLAHQHGSGSRMLAAYFVFSFSQLEVFIKTFIEDCLSTINRSTLAFDEWPDLLLGYHLHRSENLAKAYRRYGYDDNEGAILQCVADAARKIASWSTGSSALTVANPGQFLERKKYPSPKNMPQLFKRLGIGNVWALVDRSGKMQGALILTSLNDLRTEIVHEGRVPPGFGLQDFRDRLKQMRRLVAAFDRGVSLHFCTGPISRVVWNQEMC